MLSRGSQGQQEGEATKSLTVDQSLDSLSQGLLGIGGDLSGGISSPRNIEITKHRFWWERNAGPTPFDVQVLARDGA